MADFPEGLVALGGSRLRRACGFVRSCEPIPADMPIDVTLRLRQREGTPLLDLSAWTQTSIKNRDYLTEEKFAALYGAAEADIARTLDFASRNGLEVIDSDNAKAEWVARRAITLRGTPASYEQAFAVSIGRYESVEDPHESYIGREGLVYVPRALAGIIEGVFGLDSRPLIIRNSDVGLTAPASVPDPLPMARNYNFPGWKAPKQHIALMQFGGGYYQWDIDKYFKNIGVKPPTIVEVGIGGHYNRPGYDAVYDREVTLDICIAGSVAQDATLHVYFAPHTEDGWYKALEAAIASPKISVISISWGAPELQSSNGLDWTEDGMHAMTQLFKKAASKGKTVLASSGNHGSGCRIPDRKAHVSYPASDPNVIACGGTSIPDFAAAPKSESSWSSSGGGISDFPDFAVPNYQQGTVLPLSVNDGRTRRGVPDVSGYASPGYSFYYKDLPFTAPGTSLVAPLYAALIAQINADIGMPVGCILGQLYDPANAGVFADMTGARSNSSGYSAGYHSRAAWDACTGLGVIDGKKLRGVF